MSCEGLAGKFRRSTLLVVLVDGYYRWDWLLARVYKRLLEELAKLDVTVNEEKTRLVDLKEGGKFSFLGFDFQRKRTRSGKWGVLYTPRMKARTKLLHNLKDVFQRFISQPVERAIDIINPKLRGWVNYFRIGQSSRCFQYIKD
jgi:RNA-directed DNA polymerase